MSKLQQTSDAIRIVITMQPNGSVNVEGPGGPNNRLIMMGLLAMAQAMVMAPSTPPSDILVPELRVTGKIGN